jgi:four helix bundle protein
MDSFDHERLDVYRVARDANRQIASIVKSIPRGHAESKDNLQRSAKSVTRNIAEGSGKWRVADKVHFYHIARASATESAAALDELCDFGLVTEEQVRQPKETLLRVVMMLVAMIRSLESRSRPDMARPKHSAP